MGHLKGFAYNNEKQCCITVNGIIRNKYDSNDLQLVYCNTCDFEYHTEDCFVRWRQLADGQKFNQWAGMHYNPDNNPDWVIIDEWYDASFYCYDCDTIYQNIRYEIEEYNNDIKYEKPYCKSCNSKNILFVPKKEIARKDQYHTTQTNCPRCKDGKLNFSLTGFH